MKLFTSVSAIAAACLASAAQAEAGDHWSVVATPRYQRLFFQPNGGDSGVKSFNTFGGTVALRDPTSRFGLVGTFLTGSNRNSYSADYGTALSGDDIYKYHVKRQEYQAQLEYTPSETAITFIAGFHHFRSNFDEDLTNPRPGNFETNSYRNTISAGEIGIRLASRVSANSRQSISIQFLVGAGSGRYKVSEVEKFGTFTTSNSGSRKGTGMLADMALGYNYFLTNHVSLGGRARGYVFYVNTSGSEPIFAVAPEANVSFRF